MNCASHLECHTTLQLTHAIHAFRLHDAGRRRGRHSCSRQRQRCGPSAQRQHRQPPQKARPQAACDGHACASQPWSVCRCGGDQCFFLRMNYTNKSAFLNILKCRGGAHTCSLRGMCCCCCCSASDEAREHGAGAMAGTAAPCAADTAPTAPQRCHHLRRAAKSLQVCLVLEGRVVPPYVQSVRQVQQLEFDLGAH